MQLLAAMFLSVGVLGANEPVALVQRFYDLHPHVLSGLPRGEELDWLSTFISERLFDRFRSVLAYQEDWIRRHPDNPPYILKPPYADGIHFTGSSDAIDSFVVLGAEVQSPGTWNVRIHFWAGDDSDGWQALVEVKEQRGRYVIDDVIFLPYEECGETWRLSDGLDWN